MHTVLDLRRVLPLVAALIVIPITQGLPGLRELGSRMIRWRVRWYWYLAAIGLPLAVLALTAGLNGALEASAPTLVQYGSVTSVLLVFAVRLVNPGDGRWAKSPAGEASPSPGCKGPVSRRWCPP